MITAHCSLKLLGSRDPPPLASWVVGPVVVCHHANFFVEMISFYVAQTRLELLASSDPTTLASQSAGITGVSYHTWPLILNLISYFLFLLFRLQELTVCSEDNVDVHDIELLQYINVDCAKLKRLLKGKFKCIIHLKKITRSKTSIMNVLIILIVLN